MASGLPSISNNESTEGMFNLSVMGLRTTVNIVRKVAKKSRGKILWGMLQAGTMFHGGSRLVLVIAALVNGMFDLRWETESQRPRTSGRSSPAPPRILQKAGRCLPSPPKASCSIASSTWTERFSFLSCLTSESILVHALGLPHRPVIWSPGPGGDERQVRRVVPSRHSRSVYIPPAPIQRRPPEGSDESLAMPVRS